MLRLYNSLTKTTDEFRPLEDDSVRLYSCGPTVYNQAHIGNLSAYIFADILRRVVASAGYSVKHTMNITDVDDKTIASSGREFPEIDPIDALEALTRRYEKIFMKDMHAIGNDTANMTFVRATESIDTIQKLIRQLLDQGAAYTTDDGIYFSIAAYQKYRSYGQLSPVSVADNARSRINNDEYDKESAQDFALWKKQKPNEPAWPFVVDSLDFTGRPGWHIECSAMSTNSLGQPFDIHTGGIDLIFPHHENEIAQSTAGNQPQMYAHFFCHNEHVLVEGAKMSKSKHNFFTLLDLRDKGYDPLAFRMLILQSHYRSPTNFSWINLDAAQNRLSHWRNAARLRHQTVENTDSSQAHPGKEPHLSLAAASSTYVAWLQNDINTPQALAVIDDVFSLAQSHLISAGELADFETFLRLIDDSLGLNLIMTTDDITNEAKGLLQQRDRARAQKDWAQADIIRDQLLDIGIVVRDTAQGSIWEKSA